MKYCPECKELISTEEEVDYWKADEGICVDCSKEKKTQDIGENSIKEDN